jgi:SAM-dependent methyltransferase
MPTRPCPVCSDGELEPFLELPAVPVLSTEFHPTADSARTAPTGDLALALCRRCALVWNTAFDPSLVEYTSEYENSQHFSPAFRDYATALADHLGQRYVLQGRTVVEIGCGKAEFLALLCARAGCRGIGFDPTFDGEVDESAADVSIVKRYYDADTAADVDASLVLARHVVEHLPDPVGFLRSVREASAHATPVYYEVPNAEHVFSADGMWDLIYQHVGYFSAPTLDLALRRSGYGVTDLRSVFHGQFLAVEGVPDAAAAQLPDADAVARVCAAVDGFAAQFRERLDGWRQRLGAAERGSVVLWGAGAKGVAFLNLLNADGAIHRVIDINPRKSGRFVPGTGHVVDPPDVLRAGGPATVLILNPAYEDEIRTELRAIGSMADVVTV